MIKAIIELNESLDITSYIMMPDFIMQIHKRIGIMFSDYTYMRDISCEFQLIIPILTKFR